MKGGERRQNMVVSCPFTNTSAALDRVATGHISPPPPKPVRRGRPPTPMASCCRAGCPSPPENKSYARAQRRNPAWCPAGVPEEEVQRFPGHPPWGILVFSKNIKPSPIGLSLMSWGGDTVSPPLELNEVLVGVILLVLPKACLPRKSPQRRGAPTPRDVRRGIVARGQGGRGGPSRTDSGAPLGAPSHIVV